MSPSRNMECGSLQMERLPAFGVSGEVHFLAVIALYQVKLGDSASLETLQSAAARLPAELGTIDILIYDNTPGAGPQRPPDLPEYVDYFTTGRNDGLAAAFNFALALAERKKCDWLITLDQDTALPAGFLERTAGVVQKIRNEPAIAAIVPRIVEDGRVLSPNWFWLGALPKWFPKGYVGVSPHRTFAFNSASTLRVSALRQIHGYSPYFWLDNSDSHLYQQLNAYGKRVFVAGDLEVAHTFSMLDKKNRMSVSRYRNVLAAESAFWDTSMSRLAGMERTARLVGRWIKQGLNHDSPDLRNETAVGIKNRLLRSRRARVRKWKSEMELREPRAERSEAAENATRVKVSVCMAARNGERFIQEQISTVLPQLASSDEFIIVDDASEDRTQDVIAKCDDDRLILIQHESRQGIVPTFEHAIRSASGDIVFLCDQDDVWPQNKVSRVMQAFCEHQEVSLVVTNLRVIDEKGERASDSKGIKRRPFDSQLLPNLFSNRFQGSTMAFRSSLIPELLPFPQGCHVLHDAWIGLRNTITGGKCYYLDEELLLYRRHSRNASHSLNVVQKVLKRARLLAALAQREFRDKRVYSSKVV